MGSLGLIQLSMWCILVGFALIDNKVNSDNSYDFDTAEALRILLLPEENDSIQVQALRRQLLKQLSNLLQPNVEFAEQPDDGNYRRTLASLDLWNDLPEEHKRNIEALARSGMACRMFPELEPQDSTYKRSIEILAKNGQHPLVRQPIENQKRGIEALARNGDLHRPPNYQIQQGNMDYKRNLANLARTYNFPVSNGQSYGKRSLGSLAKNGELPFRYGKRNIQSLARDGVIGKRSIDSDDSPLDKRNIQSLKQRNKRQADYFENEMVYQIPITDYEDYLQELSSQGSYPVEDKRFLGSVAKSGWFRPTSQGYSSFVSLPGKRHVAALARLGWLPSYRSLRRFNRSGRSYLVTTGDDNLCRKDSTNGKTEDDSYSKGPTIPLENKRYLLQPAVDNILLRKVFRHPRTIF